MKQPRRRRPSPATAIALLALCIALGGTAFAAVGAPSGGRGDSSPDRHAGSAAKAPRATVASGPVARAAKALGSRKLSFVRASAVVMGNPQNANYNSSAARATCPRGKVALSVSTQWSDNRENLELSTVYARITVDAKGRPKGGEARGATDLPGDRIFTVYVLCAG
jgi:hypothetical protein